MATPSTAASSYATKLKDPRWQKKRLEILEQADWACEVCGDSRSTLHVHHKHYIKGREPWDYDANQLASVCSSCHESHHDSSDLLSDVVSRLPMIGPVNKEAAAKVIAGLVGQDIDCEHGRFWWDLGRVAWGLATLNARDFEEISKCITALPDSDRFLEVSSGLDAVVSRIKKTELTSEASNA